jgi:ferredoxin/flavodoxin
MMLDNKVANIVYFTGTGCTGYVADCFEEAFKKRSVITHKTVLNSLGDNTTNNADILVLLFPVYAFNAPLPVSEWINYTSRVNEKPAVVISVSGGGETTPNTACRLDTVKKLESKGYKVIYEKMLVMPSNWMLPVKDEIAIMLIRTAPIRVEKIAQDIMSRIEYRTKPKTIDRLFSLLGRMEKKVTKYFGRGIKVKDACVSCGWCANSCPRCNITMKDGKPVFRNKCVLCLRCLYGCPQKALEPGYVKFILIKEGYDFDGFLRRMEGVAEINIDEHLKKKWLWDGVRKYLMEE